MTEEKVGLKKLLKAANTNRGRLAKVGKFYLVNAPHSFATQSLYAVQLAGKLEIPSFQVFPYNLAQIVHTLGEI